VGAWDKGGTRAWRRVRARVLAENLVINGGRCAVGIKDVCTGEAECVHHVLGRAVTGDDPRYLIASCNACNLRIGRPRSSGLQHKRVTDW